MPLSEVSLSEVWLSGDAVRDIAFAVLMAGPAVPGTEVLIEQNKLLLAAAGLPADQVTAQVDGLQQIIDRLLAGDDEGAKTLAREQALAQGLPADQADVTAEQITTYRPFLSYDPRPALEALRIPTYAFFGSKDLQVPPAQSEQPMREALATAPNSEVRTFEGLNHLMQPAQTGSPAEYSTIETTLDPAVLDAVVQWLTTTT